MSDQHVTIIARAQHGIMVEILKSIQTGQKVRKKCSFYRGTLHPNILSRRFVYDVPMNLNLNLYYSTNHWRGKTQMKVMGIVCSSRKGGNTEILVKEALAGANDSGAEIELLTLRDKDIKPCDGCLACQKTGVCRIKDDMQPIYEKILNADGIIMGTPVYFWSMSGQAKVLIDRTYALRHPHIKLANKVGGVVAVAGRTGAISTLNIFQRYFAVNHMFSAEFVEGLALKKGAITKDKRGMKSAYEMGRQIVSLIKQQLKFPEEFNVPLYKYVESKYKTPRYPMP